MGDERISHEEAREAMTAGMEEIGCDDSQFDAFRRLRAYIAQQESRGPDGVLMVCECGFGVTQEHGAGYECGTCGAGIDRDWTARPFRYLDRGER